jgi:hypothetical protein
MRRKKTPKTEKELLASFMAEQTQGVILHIDAYGLKPFNRAQVQMEMGLPRGSVTRPFSDLIDFGAIEELVDHKFFFNRRAYQKLWLENKSTREALQAAAGLEAKPSLTGQDFAYRNKGQGSASLKGSSGVLIKTARWNEVIGLVRAHQRYHNSKTILFGKEIRS